MFYMGNILTICNGYASKGVSIITSFSEKHLNESYTFSINKA